MQPFYVVVHNVTDADIPRKSPVFHAPADALGYAEQQAEAYPGVEFFVTEARWVAVARRTLVTTLETYAGR